MEQLYKNIRKMVRKHYSPTFDMDKKDLMQEAHLLINELKAKYHNLDPMYLTNAVRNRLFNLLRNRRVRRKYELYVIPQELEGLEQWKLTPDEYRLLENDIDRQRFLATIKDNRLLSTVLRYIDGHSIRDIAAQDGISTKHVYRRLSKIKKLREKWENA